MQQFQRFDIVSPNQGYVTSFHIRAPENPLLFQTLARDYNQIFKDASMNRMKINVLLDQANVPLNHPIRTSALKIIDTVEYHFRQELDLRNHILNRGNKNDIIWVNQVEKTYDENIEKIIFYGATEISLVLATE